MGVVARSVARENAARFGLRSDLTQRHQGARGREEQEEEEEKREDFVSTDTCAPVAWISIVD